MATVDSNGILHYEVTDSISPLQVLLNAGQQSVSDAIGTLKTRFQVVTSGTRPVSPPASTMIFETDTGLTLMYNGVRWTYVAGMATLAFRSPSVSTPSVTPFGWTAGATIDATYSKNQSWVGTQSGENIVITEAGVYSFSAVANFSSVTGVSQLWYAELTIGGVVYDRAGINPGTNAGAANFTLYCAAGTVATALTYQNSGTPQTRSNGLLTITRHA
jgi:hypothetical protein